MDMSRSIAIVLMAGGALVALGICIYVYFTPLTGSTGTIAPIITGFGALCILIGTALIAPLHRGAWRVVLIILIALAMIGTAVAGVFILHPEIAVAIAVSAAGFIWLMADQQMHRQEARA
ncbi:hypothetical protein ACXN5S_02550 [Pseudoroseicyclus sp. H15]